MTLESNGSVGSLNQLKWAAVFLFVFVATDLFFNFFCAQWPLLFYLVAGGLGAWKAEALHKRFSGTSFFSKLVKLCVAPIALSSVVGLVVLAATPVRWDTKCSFRYCGRAMGPGLLKSPFSVGTPTCRGWWVCANEYPYSASEYSKMLKRIEAQGCPMP